MSNDPKREQVSNRWLYLQMIIMLITGSMNTIFGKLLIESKDKNDDKFKHPFIVTLLSFVAGSVGYIVYLVYIKVMLKKYTNYESIPEVARAVEKGKEPYIPWYFLALPALMDFLLAPLLNIGLILVSASVYQMMRGGLVFITALFSIIFLSSKLFRHHWLGLASIIIGVVSVGASSIESSESSYSIFIGIVLLFLSQVLSAIRWIIEEKMLKVYYIHSFRMVGLEGISAVCMSLITLVMIQFIPCKGILCPDGRLDSITVTLRQVQENYMITVYTVGLMISICIFQASGV